MRGKEVNRDSSAMKILDNQTHRVVTGGKKMKKLKLIFITALCVFVAAPAWAGLYSTVSSGSASEASLWEVLKVVTIGAVDLTQDQLNSGAGNRVFDQATLPGEVFDQFWRDGTVDVTATALWWGGTAEEGSTADQRFMYDDSIDGLSRTYIGPAAPWESGDTGTFNIGTNDPFIIGVDGNNDAWSRQSLNSPGERDRMVTFDVSGLDIYVWLSGTLLNPILSGSPVRYGSEAGSAYIVAFDTGSDTDYQDFIALIEGPAPVPVPGAVLLGLLGLSVAGIKLRKHS